MDTAKGHVLLRIGNLVIGIVMKYTFSGSGYIRFCKMHEVALLP